MHIPSVRRAAPRAAVLAGLAIGAALLLPASSFAAPGDEDVDIDELNERAEALEAEYDSELVQFTDAEEAVANAEERLQQVQDDLDIARGNVAELAAAQYKGTGLDPAVEIVMSSHPDRMLDDASVVGHVANNNGERVATLTDLEAERQEAADDAQDTLKEAEDLIDDLEEQRDDVLARIEEYEAEQVPETPGTGSVPDSAIGPGWDGATPRMASIRDEIVSQFGAPFPVGCLRPGDPGEHGSGRACDFMMSNNGGSPSAANQQLGQQIADYAQANADRLGVMYIIWEQRIWDTRNPGAGWKPMEDRGSITQNHYDHVHISSY
ncbi:coiled-coil domain-containing protein [Nocardiopsis sediminis]|uniref:Coiled-coil domain-containing protein n=1 Tax=Nocardiopsis sediminis TaxID=1778267 RepID=A0ABV8FK47_9ACTN